MLSRAAHAFGTAHPALGGIARGIAAPPGKATGPHGWKGARKSIVQAAADSALVHAGKADVEAEFRAHLHSTIAPKDVLEVLQRAALGSVDAKEGDAAVANAAPTPPDAAAPVRRKLVGKGLAQMLAVAEVADLLGGSLMADPDSAEEEEEQTQPVAMTLRTLPSPVAVVAPAKREHGRSGGKLRNRAADKLVRAPAAAARAYSSCASCDA
jgi:hypothetical protein